MLKLGHRNTPVVDVTSAVSSAGGVEPTTEVPRSTASGLRAEGCAVGAWSRASFGMFVAPAWGRSPTMANVGPLACGLERATSKSGTLGVGW